MKVEGFDSKSQAHPAGGTLERFKPKTGGSRSLVMRKTPNGHMWVELQTSGVYEATADNERVTCPVNDDHTALRLVKAMAVVHFDAKWLEDGYTEVDGAMIRRGYDVGALPDNGLLWFRKENGLLIIIRRMRTDLASDTPMALLDDPRLPASFGDPAQLILRGPQEREVNVRAADYRALVAFVDQNQHFDLYSPSYDVSIEGLYTADDSHVH